MSNPTTSSIGSWLRRAVALIVFIGRFFYELAMANLVIAKAVLCQKNSDLAPGFVHYPLKGLSRFEVLILTHVITLTPGTASVMIEEDFSELTVHAFDVRDPGAVIASIKNGLEKPLLAWTRRP
jgi:multicomponent Na+:H+ antiporter subunit E